MDNWVIESGESIQFTCVALHETFPILFIGTSRGDILKYDLALREITGRLSLNEMEDVSYPLVDVTSYKGRLYAFQSAEIVVLTEELEVLKKLDIGEEIIAATYDKDHERVLTVTRSGHIAVWNVKADFQEASITIADLVGVPKLQLIDSFIVLLSYPTGKVVQADLRTNTYRMLESFDRIDYLITTYYFDSNKTHMVNLQLSGAVHIYAKPGNRGHVERSLRSYRASVQPPEMSLKQALLSRPVRKRTSYLVHQISGMLAEISESSVEYKGLTPTNYAELGPDMNSSSKGNKSAMNSLFHQLLIEFENTEKEETLAEVVKLCEQQFLSYNFLREAWFMNEQTPENLTEDARYLQSVYKKRMSHRTTLISLELFFLTLCIALLALPPFLNSTLLSMYTTYINWLSVILVVLSVVIYSFHFRLNNDPYISFFSSYTMVGAVNVIASFSLFASVYLPSFSA